MTSVWPALGWLAPTRAVTYSKEYGVPRRFGKGVHLPVLGNGATVGDLCRQLRHLINECKENSPLGNCHSKVWEPYTSSRPSKHPLDVTAKQGVFRQAKTSRSARELCGSGFAESKAPRSDCLSPVPIASATCSGMSRLQDRETCLPCDCLTLVPLEIPFLPWYQASFVFHTTQHFSPNCSWCLCPSRNWIETENLCK